MLKESRNNKDALCAHTFKESMLDIINQVWSIAGQYGNMKQNLGKYSFGIRVSNLNPRNKFFLLNSPF